MKRELPEWWATTETGSRSHLVAKRGPAKWSLTLCGQGGAIVRHAIGAPFPLPEVPWCKACLRAAESAAESVRAELAHLERIGVL